MKKRYFRTWFRDLAFLLAAPNRKVSACPSGGNPQETQKRVSAMRYLIISMFVALLSFLSLNANALPAFVFRGDECFPRFFPDWPETDPYIDLVGDASQAAAAYAGGLPGPIPWATGKATCQGLHSEELDRAVVQEGGCFFPNSPFGPLFTENGHLVLAPSGEFSLFCKFDRPRNTD